MPPPIPRTVKLFGWVSFLTDASSEMIYPLLPAFLTGTLRATPTALGLIEGVAEAAASLLKIVSGRLSDRSMRRKPLVFFGYTISSVARPMMALAMSTTHVLAVRLTDRIGKGIRGAPRDALLAEVTEPANRGRAYGFHRAMDHAGAVVGPLLASMALWIVSDIRSVFALAALPGLASLILLVCIREPSRTSAPQVAAPTTAPVGSTMKRYLAVLALFTLGNSSEAFLLLRSQDAGVSLALIPLLWSGLHVVRSLASTHGGALSDRWGRMRTITLGWILYAVTYAGFAVASRPLHVILLFAVYGLYSALTEGAERALVADFAPTAARGVAFGYFHAVTGIMLLPASLLTGWLWQTWGAPTALFAAAGCAIAACLALRLWVATKP